MQVQLLRALLYWLASSQFTSVWLFLHWLSYHAIVGGVNVVKQDDIITYINMYYISLDAVWPSGCSSCREVCE